MYFLSRGKYVVGCDSSAVAVDFCKKSSDENKSKFITMDLSETGAGLLLSDAIPIKFNCKLFYSRFLLHAMTPNDRSTMLKSLASLAAVGDFFAFEYRALEDEGRKKVFSDHSRYYVDTNSLIKDLESLGFAVFYRVDGVGMAKYKDDDAYVSRIFFRLQ